MNRLLLLVLVCLSGRACAQLPLFRHVARFDLSSRFVVGSPLGEHVSDVACDGENLYVAGYSSSIPGVPAGILKIASPLHTPVLSNLYSVAGQYGGNRVTKLEYCRGALYLGTGLGYVSDTLSGIRKISLDRGCSTRALGRMAC